MDENEQKEMTLNPHDYFAIRGETYPKDSLFHGLNLFVRNNGRRIVKVSTDGESILISVQKDKDD